jgi:hypothetical protein
LKKFIIFCASTNFNLILNNNFKGMLSFKNAGKSAGEQGRIVCDFKVLNCRGFISINKF